MPGAHKEALTAVSSGKAFAHIGPLRTTSFSINEFGLNNLKAAAPTSLPVANTSMGIRSDWPELRDIMNKVLDSIPADEKAAMINRWSSVKFEHGIRPRDVLKWVLGVVGVASIVVLLFVAWNRQLAAKVRERTAELTSSRLRYRSVVEDSPGLICRFEPGGTITFVNDAYCRCFGKDREELVGTSFFSLIPEEDRERVATDIAALTPDASVQIHEHRVIGPDGQIGWQQWTNRAMFDEDGRVTVYQSFGEDITDLKKAQQRFRGYQQKLRALASQLTIAEERERRRIAVDLHDNVGQSLALACMQIAAAPKSAVDAGLTDKLDEISEVLREAVHDTRHLMFDLSSPSMHEIGLSAAVSEWLEEEIEKRYGIKTKFFDNVDESHRKVLDENTRAILFRNVRELLTNVVKHAYANQVSVSSESLGLGSSKPKTAFLLVTGPILHTTFQLTGNGCIVYPFLYFIYNNQEEKWP